MSDLFDASVQRFRLLDLDDEPTTPTPELDDEPGRQLIMDDEPDYQDGRAAALREIESDAWTPELARTYLDKAGDPSGDFASGFDAEIRKLAAKACMVKEIEGDCDQCEDAGPAPVVQRDDLMFGHEAGDDRLTTTNLKDVETKDTRTAFREWREAAGIDWTYSKVQATHPVSQKPIPGKFWITRDDLDDKAWGPVSGGYGLTQLDVLDVLGSVLLQEGCKIESGLVLDQGGAVAITAHQQHFDGEGPRGEALMCKTTVVDSVDTKYALRGARHLHNVVCRNTLAHAVYGGLRSWSMRHSKSVNKRVKELERIAKEMSQDGTYAERLRNRLFAYDQTHVDLDKVVSFFRKLRKADEKDLAAGALTRRNNLVDRDVDVYRNAAGAAAGTFYGLHQWATFTATHELAPKRMADDQAELLNYTVLGRGQQWQDDVVGQVDSWWQEEADAGLVQRVLVLN